MAGGEVSAPVGARVDLAKRAVAVENAENFVATFTGSMMSRPGQKYVAQAKPGAGPHRIIEFEFSDTQTFVLEMGEQYMRFHSLGAQILDSDNVKTITTTAATNPCLVSSTAHGLSNGDEVYISGIAGMTELNSRNFLVANVLANSFSLQDLNGTAVDATGYTAYTSGGTATPPYEIVTPWAAADLFMIKYAQSGDVMTLAHPDYTAQELIRVDNDTWVIGDIALIPIIDYPLNISHEENTEGEAGNITGITKANPGVFTSTAHGLVDGDIINVQSVAGMDEVNRFSYIVAKIDADTFSCTYQDGSNLNTTGYTTYTSGGTWEKWQRPRWYAVTAVSAESGEESLRGIEAEIRPSITAISKADPCVLSFGAGHGLEDLDQIVIYDSAEMVELSEGRFRVRFIDNTSFSLETLEGDAVDSTSFTTFVGPGVFRLAYSRSHSSADTAWDNTIRWTPVDGVDTYKVYATDTYGVFGYIGSSSSDQFRDKAIDPDYAITPPLFRNPFQDLAGEGGRDPGTTGFFQQRRIFANSDTYPNRFWMSQLGHFNNFSASKPPLADDAITASIAARRINDIKHIVPLTDLLLLTSGGEYRLTGGQDGVITPTTTNVSPQSYYGSTDVRPIVAGDVGLYVSPGNFIRDLGFQIESNKFVGKDVTVLARHLFDFREIIDWDYAPSPHALGFVVMEDGRGCFLTYQPDQDVYAWTQATTLGKYKSTCVVREGSYDVIYALVERVINGSTVTFLERMDTRLFDDLQDAFCVDSGLTYDVPMTVTGVTAANPVVVTVVGHGLSNGDIVDLDDIFEVTTANEGEAESADYNGTGFTVANATANTFSLQIEGVDYDGSAFAAYSSGGAARKAVTTVSGLWHLEGATVVAAANGYAKKELTVTNGSITLDAAASRIHIGLGYFARLITLPLSQYADGKTTQGAAKNVNRLTVQVEKTMGMWFGPTLDLMRETKFGLPSRYSQPLAMVTEDIDVTMKADWGKRKQVVIEQRDPLPLTVLTLIPDTLLGGN